MRYFFLFVEIITIKKGNHHNYFFCASKMLKNLEYGIHKTKKNVNKY